jgi:hypothetical protein
MRFRHAFPAVIAATLAGCGRAEPVIGPTAPHGGTLAGLPDGLGKLEIVRQDVSGKPDQARLLLYFLDPDGKPMTPAPTVATLKPKEPRGKAIGFKPTSVADPSKAGGLESTLFVTGGDISGELSSTIGGKLISVTITVR